MSAERPSQRWKPIDSVPTDGRFVLLRGGSIGRAHTDESSKQPPFVVAYYWTRSAYFVSEGHWIVTDYDGGEACVTYDGATEWASIDEFTGRRDEQRP